jgi:hypothetical protein
MVEGPTTASEFILSFRAFATKVRSMPARAEKTSRHSVKATRDIPTDLDFVSHHIDQRQREGRWKVKRRTG